MSTPAHLVECPSCGAHEQELSPRGCCDACLDFALRLATDAVATLSDPPAVARRILLHTLNASSHPVHRALAFLTLLADKEAEEGTLAPVPVDPTLN